MSGPQRDEPPEAPDRPPRVPQRRRALLAAAAALALGGGVALAVVLVKGGEQPTPAPRPPASAPNRRVSVPKRNPVQSPPWGFTGSGWQDVCYGPVATPGASRAPRVPDGRPCRPGSTRITGSTQIALTARAGADTDRIEALWSSIEPLAPSDAAARGAPRFNWAPVVSRYRTMIRDGIRPVVVAFGAPEWARAPGWNRHGGCEGCSFPPAPDERPGGLERAQLQDLLRPASGSWAVRPVAGGRGRSGGRIRVSRSHPDRGTLAGVAGAREDAAVPVPVPRL